MIIITIINKLLLTKITIFSITISLMVIVKTYNNYELRRTFA